MIRGRAAFSLASVLATPPFYSAHARVPQLCYRFASSSTTEPPNLKPVKLTKPSSKVNARTSRLLRSQLVPAAASPTPDQATLETVAGTAAVTAAEGNEAPTTFPHNQDRAETSSSSSSTTSIQPPQLQEVLAFATASSYDFTALVNSGRLPPGWQFLEEGHVIYLPAWPRHSPSSTQLSAPRSASGQVFILRTGAYITWGLNAQQAQRFRGDMLSPRGIVKASSHPAIEKGPYEESGQEEMEFVVNEEEVTRIVGDVLILGQAPPDLDSSSEPWSTLLARLSFSAGLALSARLSSQEASLSKYLSSVSSLPRLLEQQGKVPISRKDVVRKMGSLLKLRQMVNLDEGSKVEELELFWENARMEEHYDSICQTLDIEQRFRALNEQLDHAENLMGVLRALLTEGSSHRMEVIIIALIAIEVTLALISHGYIYNPFALPVEAAELLSQESNHAVASAPSTGPTSKQHAV